MAARLISFYEQINVEFGVPGRMKLAMLTQISSTKAETEADSADNLTKFEQAMAQIRRDLKA
jgi:hypothetical protein